MKSWTIAGIAAVAFGGAFAAQAQPPAGAHLGLDFLYVVVDKPTVAAVEKSAYLRRFGHLLIEEKHSSEGHYRGIFLNGLDNTLEIYSTDTMDLDHPSSDGEGRTGLEFTSDHVGDLVQVKAAAEARHLVIEQHSTHTTIDGHEVDWFTYIERAGAEANGQVVPAGFSVAMEEYFPGYMDAAHKPPARGPDDVMSRARYHRADYEASLPLRDITAATMAITREDWIANRDLLIADGFRLDERADGVHAVSRDFILDLVFVTKDKVGIRNVGFALTKAPGMRHVEQIGHSQLVVGPGANAVWSFAAR